MPIRERGYYNWDGSLKTHGIKWLPIFLNGIKSVFRKKRAKLLFAFTSFPFVGFLVVIYALSKPELKMFKDIVKQIQSDAFLFKTFHTFGVLIFGMIILSLFSGAHLISDDLKFRSFSLYLARPLSKFDYIKGKFSIVLFYLLLFSLLPGLLLIVAKIIFTGEITISLRVLLASIAFPIVVSFFWASMILMLSSLSANIKLVYILFIAFYLISNSIAGIFSQTLKNDFFWLFSMERNIVQFASFLFGTKRAFNTPGWLSGVILCSCCLVFITVLSFKLKKTEV